MEGLGTRLPCVASFPGAEEGEEKQCVASFPGAEEGEEKQCVPFSSPSSAPGNKASSFDVFFVHSSEKRHAFEILPVPFSVTPWTAPKPEHKPMNFRIDEGMPL